MLDPNAVHFMATPENFNETYQNFVIGNERVTDNTGDILRFSHMGLKLGEFQYTRPGYLPKLMDFRYDKELLEFILKLNHRRPQISRRIFNATEMFFESYYNSSSLSVNARVLLQASAFEILLHLPNRNQRKIFKDQIESITGLSGEKQYVYYSERGEKTIRETRTMKGIWADRFFSLRNHIIHGNSPPAKEYIFSHRGWSQQRHIDLGLMFFIVLVKRQIEKNLHHAFSDNIIWRDWEDPLTGVRRIGFLYDRISSRKNLGKHAQDQLKWLRSGKWRN